MALERGKLSNVVRVAAGATVGIATCTSGKKVYIKSIIAHAAGTGINTATGQVYFTQAGVTTGPTTKIFTPSRIASSSSDARFSLEREMVTPAFTSSAPSAKTR